MQKHACFSDVFEGFHTLQGHYPFLQHYPLAYRWEVRWIDATGETLVRSGKGRTQILVE
jgi:hypothetical protein